MKPKVLRNQLKAVVKEMLTEVLVQEAYVALREQLSKDNKKELETIGNLVKDTLNKIDERQATVQSMVVRELAAAQDFRESMKDKA